MRMFFAAILSVHLLCMVVMNYYFQSDVVYVMFVMRHIQTCMSHIFLAV